MFSYPRRPSGGHYERGHRAKGGPALFFFKVNNTTLEPWMDGYTDPPAEDTSTGSRVFPVPPVAIDTPTLAQMLGVSTRTISTWIRNGIFTGVTYKIGSVRLFDMEALRQWSASHAGAGAMTGDMGN